MAPPVGFDGGEICPARSEHANDGVDERTVLLRIDQDAYPFVRNGVSTTAAPAADDPQTAGRSLEIDDAETLLNAWHDVKIGQPVQIGQLLLRHEAEEPHDPGIACKLMGAAFEARTIVAVAGHDMDQAWKLCPQRGQRGKNLLMTLVALADGEPPDRQQDGTGPKRQTFHQSRRRRPWLEIG